MSKAILIVVIVVVVVVVFIPRNLKLGFIVQHVKFNIYLSLQKL